MDFFFLVNHSTYKRRQDFFFSCKYLTKKHMFSIFIGKNISPLSGIDFFHLYFTHKSGIINSWQSCWVFSLSVMSNSLQPHVLHVTHQAPLYMGFSRQGYWSGLPFPPPRDLPYPGLVGALNETGLQGQMYSKYSVNFVLLFGIILNQRQV